MSLRAISNVYGKIKRLLLVIPMDHQDSVFPAAKVHERFGRLFKAMADRVTFVVIGNFDFGETKNDGKPTTGLLPAFFAETSDPSTRLELIDLSLFPEFFEDLKDNTPNMWAQDPFCVLKDETETPTLLEPFEFGHRGNQVIAEHLSNAVGYNIRATRFFLEGGNILFGDDFLFAGKNLLEKNRERYCPNEDLERAAIIIGNEFRAIFGVDHVIWIGEDQPKAYKTQLNPGNEARQPLFHLDLFMTLGGASPQEMGKELVFLAKVDPASIDQCECPSLQEDLVILAERLEQIEKMLKCASQEMHGPEFQVVRLPMTIKDTSRGPVLFSFNNCLIETYRHIRKVYLPNYGNVFGHDPDAVQCNCPQCETIRKFKTRDFRVIMVDGSFQEYAIGQGSLHCMVKVLERQTNLYR